MGDSIGIPQREDCLVANVWTRSINDASKRPVMVWLHGGGYAAGSGSSSLYNGTGLVRRGDVVVATINHRLSDFKGGLFKSCHALEIPFVFDTTEAMPLTGSKPDKPQLVDDVSGAWIAFAHAGNPSHQGIPAWEPYTLENRATMILDVPCRLENDPAREELDAWKGMDMIP